MAGAWSEAGKRRFRRAGPIGLLKKGARTADLSQVTGAEDLDSLSLVPPGRVGRALREARFRRGLTIEVAAAMTGGRFTPADLRAAEEGLRAMPDRDIAHLCRLYNLSSGRLMPLRAKLVIDLHGRELTAAGRTVSLGGRGSLPDAVLTRYLALIYRFRNVGPGVPIRLRLLDLETLAESLHLSVEVAESRLYRLMHDEVAAIGQRSQLFGRRLVVPSAGVLVAITDVGSLVLEQAEEQAPPLPAPRRPPQLVLGAPAGPLGAATGRGAALGRPGGPAPRGASDPGRRGAERRSSQDHRSQDAGSTGAARHAGSTGSEESPR